MPLTDIFNTVLLVLIFSTSLIQCSEQELQVTYVSEDYWKNETPLRCYDCSSLDDRKCGDPFEPYSIGIVNCSEKAPPEHLINQPGQKLKPTVCRKIVQKAGDITWVVRECGYIMDSHDDKDCIRRTGTKDVEVRYCACTKSLCNDCSINSPSVSSLSLILLVAFITRVLETF